MNTRSLFCWISVGVALALLAAFLSVPLASADAPALPAPGMLAQESFPGEFDPAVVQAMLAAGVPPELINPDTVADWLLHQEQRVGKVQLRASDRPAPTGDELPDVAELPPVALEKTDTHELLWRQIETALNEGDRSSVLALAQELPEEERQQLVRQLDADNQLSPQSPDVDFIGINGAPCAYDTFAAAMAAASTGNSLYINQGVHNTTIGTINKNLKFRAASNNCQTPATSGVTLDAGNSARVALVDTSKTVTFTYLTLQHGSDSLGGIVYVSPNARLYLYHSDLISGTASSYGGCLRIFYGTVEMTSASEIIECSTTGGGDGAGVAIWGGALIMRGDSRVGDSAQNNISTDNGGGIYMDGGLLQMYDTSRVRSNQAAGDGGGIYATNGAEVELNDQASIGYSLSTAHNDATNGGGIYLTGDGTSLSLYEDSKVRYNNAAGNGGGIYATDGARILIHNGKILDNEAQNRGGGMYLGEDVKVNLENNGSINDNQTTGAAISSFGGGVYIMGPGSVMTVTGSSVMSNTSTGAYGGIRVNGDVILKLLSGTNVSYNEANGGVGGGLALSVGGVLIDDAAIKYNTSSSNGGGIYLGSGDILATDPDISFNQADNDGGGIYNFGGSLGLISSSKDGNLNVNYAIDGNGGGIYDGSGLHLNIYSLSGHIFNINTNTAGGVGAGVGGGGGIYATGSTYVDIWGRVIMTSNRAVSNGGAIYIGVDAELMMDDFSSTINPQLWVNDAVNGAGIYASGSPGVRLDGAWVGTPSFGNVATGDGGGIYAVLSYVYLNNTLVQKNTAGDDGGGLWVDTSHVYVQSQFTSTISGLTGSTLLPSIAIDCDPRTLPPDRFCSEFRSNQAGNMGGGAYIYDLTISAITHTAFISNTAEIGAAMVISGSELTLKNSRISQNSADTDPDDIVRVSLGSIDDPATLDAYQNTFADNNGTALNYSSEDTDGQFKNNIVWGNAHAGSYDFATAACNDTQDSVLPGLGNISQNPLFVTTFRGKYHLGSASPAIDQCATGYGPDLDNWPRPIGDNYDMGAFEAQFPVFLPVIRKN